MNFMKKVISLLICAILCFLLISGCNSNTTKSNGTTISNSKSSDTDYEEFIKEALMIEDISNFYYVLDDGIYKENKTSKESKQLVNRSSMNTTLGNLTIVENQLYYFIFDPDNHFDIYRVDSDGNNNVRILSDSDFKQGKEYFHGYQILNNKIFIQMSFRFYCHDIGTGKTTKLSDDIGEFQIVGNDLYFIDHANRTFTIYKMDVNTMETQIILGDGKYNPNKEEKKQLYKNLLFVGDTMYYYMRHPDGLYRYSGSESKLISDSPDIDEYSLFEHDGQLYYILKGNEKDQLMRYDPDAEMAATVLLCDDFAGEPKIKNGYFYYIDSNHKNQRTKIIN